MTEQKKINIWGLAHVAGSLSTVLNNWDSLSKDEIKIELKDLHRAIGLFGHALIKEGKSD